MEPAAGFDPVLVRGQGLDRVDGHGPVVAGDLGPDGRRGVAVRAEFGIRVSVVVRGGLGARLRGPDDRAGRIRPPSPTGEEERGVDDHSEDHAEDAEGDAGDGQALASVDLLRLGQTAAGQDHAEDAQDDPRDVQERNPGGEQAQEAEDEARGRKAVAALEGCRRLLAGVRSVGGLIGVRHGSPMSSVRVAPTCRRTGLSFHETPRS